MASLSHQRPSRLVCTVAENRLYTNLLIDTIDLLPLHHSDYRHGITEEQWVMKYVRPCIPNQFDSNISWELGKSWTKASGFNRLPRSACPFEYDTFLQQGTIDWDVQDGRIIIWIQFKVPAKDGSRTRNSQSGNSESIKTEDCTEIDPIDISRFQSPASQANQASQASQASATQPTKRRQPLQEDIEEAAVSRTDVLSETRLVGGDGSQLAGPASRTRRIKERRPAQKRRRA